MSTRPLAGRRIVVTRPREQAAEFADALRAFGAEVISVPLIRIAPPLDQEAVVSAARAVGTYDWVVFTSANAVRRFAVGVERLRQSRVTRVCAIGPGTAAALRTCGLRVNLIAPAHLQEGVLDALAAEGIRPGLRVLLPRAERTRGVLAAGLRAAGAWVDELTVYRVVPDGEGASEVAGLFAGGVVAAVTFTSASTVRNFVTLVGAEMGTAITASIGPITSAALRIAGLPVDLEAMEHTSEGLLRALVERFSDSGAA